jgi:hypothetical protein
MKQHLLEMTTSNDRLKIVQNETTSLKRHQAPSGAFFPAA